jgi:hypothetical protein
MKATQLLASSVLLGLLFLPALAGADDPGPVCDSTDTVVHCQLGPVASDPVCPGAPTDGGDVPPVDPLVSPCTLPVQAPICDLPTLENFQFTVRTVSEALPDMDATPLSPGDQAAIADWAYGRFNDLATAELLQDCLAKPAAHYLVTFDFDSGGVQQLNLGLVWHDSLAGRTFMRYWRLPLFSSAAGPYEEDYALAGAAPAQSVNYAGREFWKGTDWVTQAVHDTRVPTITNANVAPQNVPAGYTVDPVLVVWVGVSAKAAGWGGLAQTGYIKDTVNAANGDYSAFYEYFETGPGLTRFPGPFNIPPGDYVQQMIQQDDLPTGKCCIQFDAVVKDTTAKRGVTALFSTGKAVFEAKRALYIAETPTYRQTPAGQTMRDVYQQMPRLGSKIGFFNAWFYDQKSNYAYETRAGGISNQAYVLVQSSAGTPNTADGVDANGWHTVTGTSSLYNWNCAMLKHC